MRWTTEIFARVSVRHGKAAEEVAEASDEEVLPPHLTRMYCEAPDGGTHSASGWALRLGPPVALLPPSQAAPAGLDWYVNSEGMGMLLIAKGSFSMGSEKGDENEGPVQSRMVASFYLWTAR